MTKILVTGSAGFVGFHLARRLMDEGHDVFGVDDLNGYYDVGLKQARLAQLQGHPGFRFLQANIADAATLRRLFETERFGRVVHLAAQPGVRYSLVNPHAYVDSNVSGFLNVLEGCRHHGVEHLVFASSSSVYGANTKIPFSEQDGVDHPVSLYAATKKANELMAHTYAHLFGIPVTGLRFFTVYGPWGRPDMSYFLFAQAIREGRPIKVFNHGKMRRDFTYVDDVVESMVRVLDVVPRPDPQWRREAPDPASSYAPYRIYNIGHSEPVELMRFIEALEQAMGQTAVKEYVDLQPGDMEETYADVSALEQVVGFTPGIPVEEGLRRFGAWFRSYYGVTDPSTDRKAEIVQEQR